MPFSKLPTCEEFGYLKSDKLKVWGVEAVSFTSCLIVTWELFELFEDGEGLGDGVGVGNGDWVDEEDADKIFFWSWVFLKSILLQISS